MIVIRNYFAPQIYGKTPISVGADSISARFDSELLCVERILTRPAVTNTFQKNGTGDPSPTILIKINSLVKTLYKKAAAVLTKTACCGIIYIIGIIILF